MKTYNQKSGICMFDLDYTHEIRWIDRTGKKPVQRVSLASNVKECNGIVTFQYENGLNQLIDERVNIGNIVSIKMLDEEEVH